MTEKIRIKDIALRAGVSVGTVDRVLHQRPSVSPKALQKVEQALKEMNYKPNMYASALAYNRTYRFAIMIPRHESVTYWEEIEEGTRMAVEARGDFHVEAKMYYFDRFSDPSFLETADQCLADHPDGVVMVPVESGPSRIFTDKMHATGLPFVMLDSYMPDLKPLAFFGQDSFSSGYFAARVLMLIARGDEEIMLFKLTTPEGRVASRQQDNREVGFRNYMKTHYPDVTITELDLPIATPREEQNRLLDEFFNRHPRIHNCITVGSKAHIVGDFLLRAHRHDIQIMGYDMVEKNAECLRKGSISFLIAQHAYQQGYCSINALFRAIVLKQKVQPVNYMPIELLSKENVDFYRRTQL